MICLVKSKGRKIYQSHGSYGILSSSVKEDEPHFDKQHMFLISGGKRKPTKFSVGVDFQDGPQGFQTFHQRFFLGGKSQTGGFPTRNLLGCAVGS